MFNYSYSIVYDAVIRCRNYNFCRTQLLYVLPFCSIQVRLIGASVSSVFTLNRGVMLRITNWNITTKKLNTVAATMAVACKLAKLRDGKNSGLRKLSKTAIKPKKVTTKTIILAQCSHPVQFLSKKSCPENVDFLSYRGRFSCLITARRRKKSDAVRQFFD